MNNVLQLKGKLHYASNSNRPGPAVLPRNAFVEATHVHALCQELYRIISFWAEQPLQISPLVAVHYMRVVPKSSRIAKLFPNANDKIRGAKFTEDSEPKLIITYQVSPDKLQNACKMLEETENVITTQFGNIVKDEDINKINKGITKISSCLSQTTFSKLIREVYFIEHFGVPNERENQWTFGDTQVVTLFDTKLPETTLLRQLGMQDEVFPRFSNLTWQLNPTQFSTLVHKAPYLVSMSVTDVRNISFPVFTSEGSERRKQMPTPNGEPIIGVIDTPFNPSAYFHEWVDAHCLLSDEIKQADYEHGTAVDSLLVDGPGLNPALDDGCGFFRVRHFGVAREGRNSSFEIMQRIKEIVSSNRDIKVWNLSLGALLEINPTCISPEAAMLDELQFEQDVVFVVSGTNNPTPSKDLYLCPPADSINAIIVNSVMFNGQPPTYARRGPVLRYFAKPDVCAHGGDTLDPVRVYSQQFDCVRKAEGTSYAAPWITRKLAYLIYIMKYTREAAKALLLDAAAGWTVNKRMQPFLGFGPVPTKISDVVQTPDDEIKFIINGSINAYQTYAFNIPVPQTKHTFPFITKATLCYFPNCTRNQGVDYTNSELDLHFGRMKGMKIKSINNNGQGGEGSGVYELDARNVYQKWNNVKHISEELKSNNRSKKAYDDSSMWGFLINKVERLNAKDGDGLHFSLVVTLKNINGENRYREFIKLCETTNWFVLESSIETMVATYVQSEEEIRFDE